MEILLRRFWSWGNEIKMSGERDSNWDWSSAVRSDFLSYDRFRDFEEFFSEGIVIGARRESPVEYLLEFLKDFQGRKIKLEFEQACYHWSDDVDDTYKYRDPSEEYCARRDSLTVSNSGFLESLLDCVVTDGILLRIEGREDDEKDELYWFQRIKIGEQEVTQLEVW